jgi:GNAT superfamily N-acetyltransferase
MESSPFTENLDKPRVVRMPQDRFDDVVAVFCAAFHDYPVMRYVLKDAGEDYDGQLTELIGYFTDSRFSRDWPVLGVSDRNELVAAANINPPQTTFQATPPPDSLQRRLHRLRTSLGDAAIERFQAHEAACEPFEPKEQHYYLGMLGVSPAHQGYGYARLLLDAVHRMSVEDQESHGVVLTTETPNNLPFYEHFGYQVLGLARVEELKTWTLFRPD